MYRGNRWQLLADYNAWMNERLYAVCGSMSDDERKRNRGAFFKSIHSTLNHILWADRNWMTRLAGKSYSPALSLGTDVFADFDELSAARAALDAEIGDWAGGLTDEQLNAPYTSRAEPASHACAADLGVRQPHVQPPDAPSRPADDVAVASRRRLRRHGHSVDAAPGVTTMRETSACTARRANAATPSITTPRAAWARSSPRAASRSSTAAAHAARWVRLPTARSRTAARSSASCRSSCIDLEWGHPKLTELRIVEDLRIRKHQMLSQSHGLVVLPGGCGTFEELFEALTLKRLGLYVHPIVLVNTRDYFAPLIDVLEHMVTEQFMGPRHLEMWQVVATPDEVPHALQNAPPWSEAAREFAVARARVLAPLSRCAPPRSLTASIGRAHISRMKTTTILGLVLTMAAGAVLAQTADTFTAYLDWVPISGAERNDVAGRGSATATLSRSQLQITGCFAGSARRRDAREPAPGRRDGRARPCNRRAHDHEKRRRHVQRCRRARSRAACRAACRTPLYTAALGTRRRHRTAPCCGAGCSPNQRAAPDRCRGPLTSRHTFTDTKSHAIMHSTHAISVAARLRPARIARAARARVHRRASRRRAARPTSRACATCHGANLRQLPNALLAGQSSLARWGNRATNDLVTQARSTMPPDNPGGLPAGDVREHRRLLAASRTAAQPSDERRSTRARRHASATA